MEALWRELMRCPILTPQTWIAALWLLPLTAAAQWLNYPTPGIPRLPDGKPNLSAPVPRTTYGKPDLSGLWQPVATIANRFGNGQVPPEGVNIAANLKEPLPLRPWALDL